MTEQAKVLTLRDDQSGAAIAPAFALTPMAMLSQAVAQGASIELVGKLMDLAERWERNQARKAFDAAIADAKSEIKPIVKNRSVSFGANKTAYRHEDLAAISDHVDPILSKHGLFYRYRTITEGGTITVVCILSHRDGHSEENSLCASPDATGGKNGIQAVGSTQTYLQRYTLKAALGLAASNDDDGRAAGDSQAPSGHITEEQIGEIQSLLVHTGSDVPRFLRFMKVEKIEDIAARDFDKAMTALRKKEARS